MNIFVLNESPKTSAEMMLNKHVIKMPLESMQMLSTIATHLKLNAPYKPVMLNHPSTIWARESKQNYQWLLDHCLALCEEYTFRYGKTHKVETTYYEYTQTWEEALSLLPDTKLTPFAIAISQDMNCRKVDGFDAMTTIEKYQQYYIHDKWPIAEWKRKEPSWWPHKHEVKMKQQQEEQLQSILLKWGIV